LRSGLVVVSLSSIILLALFIPGVSADTMVFIGGEEDASPIPIVFGNSTEHPRENSMCFSVTADGTMFMVSYHAFWQLCRGETPVSLIAWSNDGRKIWSHTFGCWRKQLFDVTNVGSYVYVTGRERSDIFLGKYDFDGKVIWNTTVDLGASEVGHVIFILEDGTIIIGGSQTWEVEPDQHQTKGILLAMNQSGEYSWHTTYEEFHSLQCDSNYIYLASLSTLQKLDRNGNIVWFVDSRNSYLGCVRDEILYTYRNYHTNYSTSSNTSYYMVNTEIDILSWSTETGHTLNVNNIRFCDEYNQMFNRTELQTTIAQDGSLKIVIGSYDLNRWYLASISQTTELTSCKLLLNGSWRNVRFDMDDSDNVYLAADSRTYGLTVMSFDSAQLALAPDLATTVISAPVTFSYDDLLDVRIVGITAVGVALFDVIFIIYLKRRVAK